MWSLYMERYRLNYLFWDGALQTAVSRGTSLWWLDFSLLADFVALPRVCTATLFFHARFENLIIVQSPVVTLCVCGVINYKNMCSHKPNFCEGKVQLEQDYRGGSLKKMTASTIEEMSAMTWQKEVKSSSQFCHDYLRHIFFRLYCHC